MSVFYRGTFTALWLNISSNEALGILDTDYIEDYNGVDGHITLFNVGTGTPYDVVMLSVPSETPSVDNDYFRGAISLLTIPNGQYEVRCRVKDVVGNYTIIGAVSSPIGGERILSLPIDVLAGDPVRYIVDVGPLALRGGRDVDVSRHLNFIDRSRLIEKLEGPGFERISRTIS